MGEVIDGLRRPDSGSLVSLSTGLDAGELDAGEPDTGGFGAGAL